MSNVITTTPYTQQRTVQLHNATHLRMDSLRSCVRNSERKGGLRRNRNSFPDSTCRFGVAETPPFPVIQQNTRYSSSFRLLFPLPLSSVHALLVPLAGTIHGRERGQSLGYAFGVLRKADGEELGQSEIPLPDHSATPHVVLAD